MSFCVNLEHRSLKAGDIIALARDFKSGRHDLVFSSLKLSYNCLGDPGAGVIASYLGEDYSITSLDLCFNDIGDAGIEAIARSLSHNGSLKVLHLSGNSVSPKGFKYLSSALAINSCLTSLHLTGNSGEAEGTAAIAAALRVNRSVSALCLNGNKIGPIGCRHLSETLAYNDTLQVLMLSDNEIGDAGAICLGRALRFHKFLQVLELSFNKITAVGIEELCRHFCGYAALRKLQLDNNKMGDKGLKMLARVITSMRLKELNVGFNDVGPEGAVALLEAVSPNQGLLALNISGCAIKSEGALLLATLLRGDVVLQELYLDRANIGAGGERNVSMGIATNRKLALRILTGFHLGRALVQLGSPNGLASMPNEATLKYLADMWAAKLVDGCSSSASSSSSVKSHQQQLMTVPSYLSDDDREPAANGDRRGRNGNGNANGKGQGQDGSRSGGRDATGAASMSMDKERRETNEKGGSDSNSSSSDGSGGGRQGAHAQMTPQPPPKPSAPTPLRPTSVAHTHSHPADPNGVGRHVEEAGPLSGRSTEPTFESIGMVSLDSSDLLGIFDGDALSWEDAGSSHSSSSRRTKAIIGDVSNVSSSSRKINVQRGADDTVYLHISDTRALAEGVPLSPISTQGQGGQGQCLTAQECEAVATTSVAMDSKGSEGGRGECSYCESRMGRIEQSQNEDVHYVCPLAPSSFSSSSSSSSTTTTTTTTTTTKSSIQYHHQLTTIDRESESSPIRKGNVELSLAKEIAEGKGEANQERHGDQRFQSPIAMSHSSPLPHRAEHFASAQSTEPTLEVWDPSTLGAVEHAAIRDANVPDFVLHARDIGKVEFQPADLWELHQHYFSPPQWGRPNREGSSGSLEENGASSGSGSDTDWDEGAVEGAGPSGTEAGHSSGLELEQHLRQRGLALGVLRPRRPAAAGASNPRKRPRNRRTLARIMFYPRVQHRLESLKTEADSPRCLTLLRQLRFLEEHCRSELRDLDADLEDVLLNLVDGH